VEDSRIISHTGVNERAGQRHREIPHAGTSIPLLSRATQKTECRTNPYGNNVIGGTSSIKPNDILYDIIIMLPICLMRCGFAAGRDVSSFSARNNVSLRTHNVRVITEIRESEQSTAFFCCM